MLSRACFSKDFLSDKRKTVIGREACTQVWSSACDKPACGENVKSGMREKEKCEAMEPREEFRHIMQIRFFARGKSMPLTICGNSMSPLLNSGDQIAVKPQKAYQVGDVVAFFYDHVLLVHRIVQMQNDSIVCKGDNSFRLEHIAIEDIVGKAVARNGKCLPELPAVLLEQSLAIGQLYQTGHMKIAAIREQPFYEGYQTALQAWISKS